MLSTRDFRGVLLAFAAPCTLASLSPRPAGAQEPQRIIVTRATVKPEMNDEYLDLVAQLATAHKKSGTPFFAVWETGVFGDLSEIVTVTPRAKFAIFDEPSPARKFMGEDGYQKWLAKVRKCTVGVRRSALLYRPECSIQSGKEPGLMVLTMVRIVPGRTLDFESILKSDTLAAVKKAEVRDYWVYQTMFGGETPEYTILTSLDKYADIDMGSPLVRALGREGAAKLSMKMTGIVRQSEYSITRHNKELSYRSAP